MGQYLHLFDTVSAFTEAYNGEAYQEPWVSYTEETSAVTYNKPTPAEQVRMWLMSLPYSSHIVGIMPDFPSPAGDQPFGDYTYEQYYPESMTFAVDECPGWGWARINQVSDSWFVDMIESVDWEHVYSHWLDSENGYPFRILFDVNTGTIPSGEEPYVTSGFFMEYENGNLSLNEDPNSMESLSDDDYGWMVKTAGNQIYYTTRYYED